MSDIIEDADFENFAETLQNPAITKPEMAPISAQVPVATGAQAPSVVAPQPPKVIAQPVKAVPSSNGKWIWIILIVVLVILIAIAYSKKNTVVYGFVSSVFPKSIVSSVRSISAVDSTKEVRGRLAAILNKYARKY